MDIKPYNKVLHTAFVGKSEEEVDRLLLQWDCDFRVVRRDGNPYIVTRDYKMDRINLVIEKGLIVEATYG